MQFNRKMRTNLSRLRTLSLNTFIVCFFYFIGCKHAPGSACILCLWGMVGYHCSYCVTWIGDHRRFGRFNVLYTLFSKGAATNGFPAYICTLFVIKWILNTLLWISLKDSRLVSKYSNLGWIKATNLLFALDPKSILIDRERVLQIHDWITFETTIIITVRGIVR